MAVGDNHNPTKNARKDTAARAVSVPLVETKVRSWRIDEETFLIVISDAVLLWLFGVRFGVRVCTFVCRRNTGNRFLANSSKRESRARDTQTCVVPYHVCSHYTL